MSRTLVRGKEGQVAELTDHSSPIVTLAIVGTGTPGLIDLDREAMLTLADELATLARDMPEHKGEGTPCCPHPLADHGSLGCLVQVEIPDYGARICPCLERRTV